MFETSNPQVQEVTTGKYKDLIIETDGQGNKNVSINYEEGYILNENFVSLGVNHIIAIDQDEYKDSDGNIVPAKTGYSDFEKEVIEAGNTDELKEKFIKKYI